MYEDDYEELNLDIPEEPTVFEGVLLEDEIASLDEIQPIIIGVVVNCLELNVRELPSKDAKIICVIKCLTEVVVDEDESTDDFYKVYLESGVEGYCMKKFIAIRK